jgi:hypothetical protein
MNKKQFVAILILVVLMLLLAPASALAKPDPKGKPTSEPTEEAGNNLSFPVIAVDGFAITPFVTPSFTVAYTGLYPGLTAEEIAALVGAGPWYAQKTEGNEWQADFDDQSTAVDVTYIDWGDNIESVYPKVRTPFRLEVTLYKDLGEGNEMTAYTMAVLEYPSSSTELQGTNNITYDNQYATVISTQPKLVIQYLEGVPADAELTWDTSGYWVYEIVDEGEDPVTITPNIIPVSFAPELNVGGKYIFGASEGGWKPTLTGYYRITFYVPSGSGVSLASAEIRNYADLFTGTASEGTAATPVVVPTDNLTYVDVQVMGKGSRK